MIQYRQCGAPHHTFFFYISNVEFYISCFEKFYITKCRIYISNVEKKSGVSAEIEPILENWVSAA